MHPITAEPAQTVRIEPTVVKLPLVRFTRQDPNSAADPTETDEYRMVMAAFKTVDSAWSAAYEQFVHQRGWLRTRRSQARRLAELTVDKRWLTVGANVEHLSNAVDSLKVVAPPAGGTDASPVTPVGRIPTMDAAVRFVEQTDKVNGQIQSLVTEHLTATEAYRAALGARPLARNARRRP